MGRAIRLGRGFEEVGSIEEGGAVFEGGGVIFEGVCGPDVFEVSEMGVAIFKVVGVVSEDCDARGLCLYCDRL